MTTEPAVSSRALLPQLMLFGTTQAPPRVRRLRAGPLTADLVEGTIRSVCWHGMEVIRGINYAVRDPNWATCEASPCDITATTGADHFEVKCHSEVADGALTCNVIFTGEAAGLFRATLELTARTDFDTNRAGLTVLHPQSLAGTPFSIFHTDGTAETSRFPGPISPGQVALNIAGLQMRVREVGVGLTFSGDTFEMEDQRNWSDASYKTYCRPLALPTPYRIAAGAVVRQQIEVTLHGMPRLEAQLKRTLFSLQMSGEPLPVVALALDAASLPRESELTALRLLPPRSFQLRVDPNTAEEVLGRARALVEPLPEIALEIVIPDAANVDAVLGRVADCCTHTAVRPNRVCALPEAYLRSYQPDGPWPRDLAPRVCAAAARRWFPEARIGCGVFTNFTELNRCRPKPSECDYITHASTAILHAADDRSVIESLEGLKDIFASGRLIAERAAYHAGLIAIGMRSNPYGHQVVPNPHQIRLAAAGIDPRQRGLFAAAWSVGVIAATEGHGLGFLAIAMPVGAFGVVYRRASWPQPLYDYPGDDFARAEASDGPSTTQGAQVYPLFHVVRALSQMVGATRLSLDGLPPGIVGVAVKNGTGSRLILSNLAAESRGLQLPQPARVRYLTQDTFRTAIARPEWLSDSTAQACSHITLDAFDVAFIDMPSITSGDGACELSGAGR